MRVLTMAFALALTGCATSPWSRMTDRVVDNGLSRFDDRNRDTTCYVYRDSDGSSISCIRIDR
jgi:hypothetical protein